MSLPHTGRFEAKADVWTCIFDGDNWTGSGPMFDEGLRPMLEYETRRHQGNHITVEEVGTSVLDHFFAGKWTLISCESDTWDKPLPPGAVD